MLVSANSAKMCDARADGMVRFVARTGEVWGLVNRVVSMAELDEATAHLLGRATRGRVVSKGIGKQAFYTQIGLDQPKAYAHAIEVMSAAGQIPVAQERNCCLF